MRFLFFIIGLLGIAASASAYDFTHARQYNNAQAVEFFINSQQQGQLEPQIDQLLRDFWTGRVSKETVRTTALNLNEGHIPLSAHQIAWLQNAIGDIQENSASSDMTKAIRLLDSLSPAFNAKDHRFDEMVSKVLSVSLQKSTTPFDHSLLELLRRVQKYRTGEEAQYDSELILKRAEEILGAALRAKSGHEGIDFGSQNYLDSVGWALDILNANGPQAVKLMESINDVAQIDTPAWYAARAFLYRRHKISADPERATLDAFIFGDYSTHLLVGHEYAQLPFENLKANLPPQEVIDTFLNAFTGANAIYAHAHQAIHPLWARGFAAGYLLPELLKNEPPKFFVAGLGAPRWSHHCLRYLFYLA